MGLDEIKIEILEKIYSELVMIREHLTRDKLAEMEEQATLTKRYMIKQDTINKLAVSLLRDGKIKPKELFEASEQLDIDPEKLEKEVKEYLENKQREYL